MSELSSNDDDKNTRKVRKKKYIIHLIITIKMISFKLKQTAPTLQDFEGIINIFKLYFCMH